MAWSNAAFETCQEELGCEGEVIAFGEFCESEELWYTGQISVNVSSTKDTEADVATDNAEEEVSSDADVKKALEQLLQRGLRALTLIGKAAKNPFLGLWT